MDIGAIIQRIQQLPAQAQAILLRSLKLSDIEYTPAGAVLVAIQLLCLLDIPRTIDQLLGEEHTSVEALKADYDRGKRPVPSTGMVLSILIADMLAYPKHLTRIYKIEEMAHLWKTGPLLGICPTVLNDDRILRALSALGQAGTIMEETLHLLALHTSERFSIPLTRFFIDTSLLELDGEFAKAAKVTLGRGRDSMSQLLVSLTCAAGSRIPVAFAVNAGNTNDGTTFSAAFAAIERIASPDPVEIIMDRAFPTAGNVALLQEQSRECYFIAPLKTEKAGNKFKSIVEKIWEEDSWKPINFRSAEEIRRKLERMHSAYETQWVLVQETKPELKPGQNRRPKGSIIRKEVPVRCVIYRDGRRAQQEKQARLRQRQALDDVLNEFAGKINKRKLTTVQSCQEKVQEICKPFSAVNSFVELSFGVNTHGAVVFSWDWDETAYAKEEQYDGIFALLTTHPASSVSANELLKRYRNRNEIEMDFSGLKGILDLEQVFLQLPERIDAYIFLKILAYFVLAFLRWYAQEHGYKKVTEEQVQDALSKMGICMQELLPLHIPHWSVSTEKGLSQWFRATFNLPDPHDEIQRLNQLVDKDEIIRRWFQNVLDGQIVLE